MNAAVASSPRSGGASASDSSARRSSAYASAQARAAYASRPRWSAPAASPVRAIGAIEPNAPREERRVDGMKHVLILGAGFGGLELASRLSDSVPDAARVTLIDQNDAFTFGFSKLDILFGGADAADLRIPYRELAKPAVEFRQERITAIDPAARRVTTDGGSYDADILIVALGANYDLAATPGFAEGGLEYYSVAGAERMRDALPEFAGGTILFGILGQPFKCPPAPFEGAFLLHDQLVERGIRERTEIRVIAPMSVPVPVTPEVSQRL